MEKRKVDILRRKMISSGLASIATISMGGGVTSLEAKADEPCSGPQCSSCDSGCYSCAVCSTCQIPSSKGEPQL